MAKIIGIDLGTTNSCVAIMEGGKPKVIENSEGTRTTPSVVAYTDDGEVLVGAAAKRQAVTNAKNTIYAVKRLIGRKFDEKETQKDIKLMPYKIVARRQRRRLGRGARQEDRAAAGLGRDPAQDEEDRRGLPRRGGEGSGDHGSRLLQRFAAPGDQGRRPHRRARRQAHHQRAHRGRARLRHGQGRQEGHARSRCTTSAAAPSTSRSSRSPTSRAKFEVLSTNGDTFLGGEDFDQRLIDYIVAEFKKDQGVDLSKDVLALQRLKESAEKAKIELSSLAADRDQPALHHRGPERAEAPHHEDHPRQVRVAGGRSHREDHRTLRHRDQGRRHQREGDSTT